MRFFFHAPRSLIEHPALLCEQLGSYGIGLQLDGTSRASGQIEGTALSLGFHPKRFVANLSVAVEISLAPPLNSSISTEDYLATLKTLMNRHDAVRVFITEALAKLNTASVESPVDSEVAFAQSHCHNPGVDEIVGKIHQEQTLIDSSVEHENFEAAAYHVDNVRKLLDSLYDLRESGS